jgi:hypothetical protein
MRRTRIGRLAVVAIASFAVSCGDATGPGFNSEITEAFQLADYDLARSAGGSTVITLPPLSFKYTGPALSCAFDALDQRFECRPLENEQAGFIYTRSYYLLAANGTARSEWSSDVVAVRVITDVGGEIGMPGIGQRDIARVEQREDVTIRGFGTASRSIQGMVMSRFTATSRQDGSTYVVNQSRAIDLTTPPAPVGTTVYPTGTMTVIETSGRRTVTVAITYDGRPAPAVVITDVWQPPI